MTDEKTAFFRVKFQSTIDEERVINIVAQDMPQGFYRSLQKVRREKMNQGVFFAQQCTMYDFHNFGLIFTGQCTVCLKG